MRARVVSHFSCVRLFVALWTVAHRAPLFMGFSRQIYWSESPCPPAGDLANPGIKPLSLKSPALAGRFFTTSTTWEAHSPLLVNLSSLSYKLQKAGYLLYSNYEQLYLQIIVVVNLLIAVSQTGKRERLQPHRTFPGS